MSVPQASSSPRGMVLGITANRIEVTNTQAESIVSTSSAFFQVAIPIRCVVGSFLCRSARKVLTSSTGVKLASVLVASGGAFEQSSKAHTGRKEDSDPCRCVSGIGVFGGVVAATL